MTELNTLTTNLYLFHSPQIGGPTFLEKEMVFTFSSFFNFPKRTPGWYGNSSSYLLTDWALAVLVAVRWIVAADDGLK